MDEEKEEFTSVFRATTLDGGAQYLTEYTEVSESTAIRSLPEFAKSLVKIHLMAAAEDEQSPGDLVIKFEDPKELYCDKNGTVYLYGSLSETEQFELLRELSKVWAER